MSAYLKTFKDADKSKYNKLMSFSIENDKLLKKYKTIWTKIEDLQGLEVNFLPVHNDRYIKTKIITYAKNVNTNFRGSNVSEDGVEFESFTITSFDSSLVYGNKYYLHI